MVTFKSLYFLKGYLLGMFRMWGRIFSNTRLINDTVIEDDSNDSRTHKVFNSLDKICNEFGITRPIWLDKNISDFQKMSRVRFNSDNFIESIDFDYLEIRILEEDFFY